MRRSTWLFVIWLLALALPVQGLAAATMLHCASSDGAAAHDAPGHHASGAHHAAHPHDGAASNHAAQAPHGMHPASHANAGHDSQDADSGSKVLHKCSACATCCVGLGLPSTAYSVPEPMAASTFMPAPTARHAAFFTSGPERPPRPLPL